MVQYEWSRLQVIRIRRDLSRPTTKFATKIKYDSLSYNLKTNLKDFKISKSLLDNGSLIVGLKVDVFEFSILEKTLLQTLLLAGFQHISCFLKIV